ncbi:MAG: hypothetical protein B7Z07_01800 [Sphingomonadales bacterium 32-67-7]|nr:MAG: hypothetical protein B7Z07_01800 [Sphingomonadales bacterium 32-67-7]
MSKPPTLLSLAESYIAEQRALGFNLGTKANLTRAFARFADGIGHEGPITAELVLRWARDEATRPSRFTWAGRVAVLRTFATHLTRSEPATAFPDGLPFGRSTRRVAPHIYTAAEVNAIVTAAGQLSPEGGLTGATYSTLFGLLAATGLRVSEALRLCCGDLDTDGAMLTVHRSKYGRTRLVPLHATTAMALRRYLAVRARYGTIAHDAPLFLSETTLQRLRYHSVRSAFLRLAMDLGLTARGGHRIVRIHDLRHTFICRRLMLWQEQDADIHNALVALSAYVGHATAVDTYWYLQAVPELMAVAGERFGAFAAGPT